MLYLASHICCARKRNNEIIVSTLPIFSCGEYLEMDALNGRCQDLFERPNFEFVRHDITEPFRAEVDQIYNMACPASPVHYQYNPIKTTKVRNCCLKMSGV